MAKKQYYRIEHNPIRQVGKDVYKNAFIINKIADEEAYWRERIRLQGTEVIDSADYIAFAKERAKAKGRDPEMIFNNDPDCAADRGFAPDKNGKMEEDPEFVRKGKVYKEDYIHFMEFQSKIHAEDLKSNEQLNEASQRLKDASTAYTEAQKKVDEILEARGIKRGTPEFDTLKEKYKEKVLKKAQAEANKKSDAIEHGWYKDDFKIHLNTLAENHYKYIRDKGLDLISRGMPLVIETPVGVARGIIDPPRSITTKDELNEYLAELESGRETAINDAMTTNGGTAHLSSKFFGGEEDAKAWYEEVYGEYIKHYNLKGEAEPEIIDELEEALAAEESSRAVLEGAKSEYEEANNNLLNEKAMCEEFMDEWDSINKTDRRLRNISHALTYYAAPIAGLAIIATGGLGAVALGVGAAIAATSYIGLGLVRKLVRSVSESNLAKKWFPRWFNREKPEPAPAPEEEKDEVKARTPKRIPIKEPPTKKYEKTPEMLLPAVIENKLPVPVGKHELALIDGTAKLPAQRFAELMKKDPAAFKFLTDPEFADKLALIEMAGLDSKISYEMVMKQRLVNALKTHMENLKKENVPESDPRVLTVSETLNKAEKSLDETVEKMQTGKPSEFPKLDMEKGEGALRRLEKHVQSVELAGITKSDVHELIDMRGNAALRALETLPTVERNQEPEEQWYEDKTTKEPLRIEEKSSYKALPEKTSVNEQERPEEEVVDNKEEETTTPETARSVDDLLGEEVDKEIAEEAEKTANEPAEEDTDDAEDLDELEDTEDDEDTDEDGEEEDAGLQKSAS